MMMSTPDRRFLQARWVVRAMEEIQQTNDPQRLAELRRALQEMRAEYLEKVRKQRSQSRRA